MLTAKGSCSGLVCGGALDPILLCWCPLNFCLCISSLLSHKRCSGLFISFFFNIILLAFPLFFISYFLSLCCPCPFMTPTSHIPLLKDGGVLCEHVSIIWMPEAWRLWSISVLSVCPDLFAPHCQRVFGQIIQPRSVSTYSDLVSSSGSLKF